MRTTISAALAVLVILQAAPAATQVDAAERMRTAAADNRSEEVRAALDARVDPNAADANGYTALMWAAEHNRPEIVALLLSRGADPNRKNKYGYDAGQMGKHYPRIVAALKAAGGRVPPPPPVVIKEAPVAPPARPARYTPAPTPPKGGDYCRAMYTRSYGLCTTSSCKIITADKWATCQKTGRWP